MKNPLDHILDQHADRPPQSSRLTHPPLTSQLRANSVTNHQSTGENRSEARDDSTYVSITDGHPSINTHTLRSMLQYHQVHLTFYQLIQSIQRCLYLF